ncbi:MAG: HAMP domain-containing histidine kinase, partial [Lachnospiraceae bacterium]|nr:HAMP domain-containing histidine kinase [Lachnospiraceae bacterium]
KGFGDGFSEDEMGAFVAKSGKAIIKKIDFRFPDETSGKAFIITSASAVIPETRSLVIDMLVSCVLILLFTAAMLAFWIYNGTISPIAKLSAATKKIMDDDFDFTIIPESDDEIGELCKNFEEMRSKLEQYAKERLEAENTNRELISNISHDLKTPLTTIRGYCEGIMDGVADTPEKIEHYVMTIYNKTNEMTNLVNELTLYSKLDTNRIPYNFQKINVASYFDDCVTDLYMELENENITVSYEDYAADDIVIIADPEQLKRVINNIVSNTVKYLDKPKGNINIRIRDVGDFIQVEIEDNGSGIAAKDLPYIFDRFYRSDASRNSSKGGSGIGLSIVKKIIEDHGGKIWATSREGNGTVMYFVLRKYQENREE